MQKTDFKRFLKEPKFYMFLVGETLSCRIPYFVLNMQTLKQTKY